jgi:hypothetical protein
VWSTIPTEAILHPELYYYKFEVNTTKPYSTNQVRVFVNDWDLNTNDTYGTWDPPLDTKGAWQTVVLPFETLLHANTAVTADGSGYFCGFLFCGPGPLDCDISFDNFRIVPKVPK